MQNSVHFVRCWLLTIGWVFCFCSLAQARFRQAEVLPKTQTAAVVDYNKDGYTDIINGMEVFWNQNGKLVSKGKVPRTPKEGKATCGNQTAWADFDGDGTRDVLVFGFAPCRDRVIKVRSSRTTGIVTFLTHHDIQGWDVPWTGWNCSYPNGKEVLGLNQNATWGVAVADVDRDGKLDIYLGRGRIGDMTTPDKPEYYGKDWLVKNASSAGTLKFVDITNAVGMTPEHQKKDGKYRHVEGMGAADYDLNGFPDFFIGHYRGADNFFWKGAGGGAEGFLFSNASEQLGQQQSTGVNLSNAPSGSPWVHHGGGVAWLDFNNDGFLDLIEARLHHHEGAGQTAVRLWRNKGDGTFVDESYRIPGDAGGSGEEGYASGHYKCVAFGDFDNDGKLDLYLTRSVQSPSPLPKQQLFEGSGGDRMSRFFVRGFGRMLRNDGDRFIDVTEELNLHNPEHMDVFAAAMFDFDNDGKLDLFTCQGWGTSDGQNELWRNETPSDGHWLAVDLRPWENSARTKSFRGLPVNSDAIGAIVQICIDLNGNKQPDPGEILTRLQQGNTTGGMFLGPQPLHFGLGNCDVGRILWLRVLWPGQEGLKPDGAWSDNWQYFQVPALDTKMTLSLSE